MEGKLICGCMVEGESIPCVFDDPAFTGADCNYAKPLHAEGKGRDDCEYWKPMADEEHAASHFTAEIERLTAECDRYKAEAQEARHAGRMEALNAVFSINGPSRAIAQLKAKYTAEFAASQSQGGTVRG